LCRGPALLIDVVLLPHMKGLVEVAALQEVRFQQATGDDEE
jgi:hypothetical protein